MTDPDWGSAEGSAPAEIRGHRRPGRAWTITGLTHQAIFGMIWLAAVAGLVWWADSADLPHGSVPVLAAVTLPILALARAGWSRLWQWRSK